MYSAELWEPTIRSVLMASLLAEVAVPPSSNEPCESVACDSVVVLLMSSALPLILPLSASKLMLAIVVLSTEAVE